MAWFHPHASLLPHHRYQLEVIWLFVAGILLFIPYYIAMERAGYDLATGQWYFFWPWMAGYVVYSLYQRNKIPRHEAVDPLQRPILHWVLLGVVLILTHTKSTLPITLTSIDLSFGIFSLFLADSYWDFTNPKKRS